MKLSTEDSTVHTFCVNYCMLSTEDSSWTCFLCTCMLSTGDSNAYSFHTEYLLKIALLIQNICVPSTNDSTVYTVCVLFAENSTVFSCLSIQIIYGDK